MQSLPQLHAQLIRAAIEAAQADGTLPPFAIPEIPITPSKRADQGDYACPVAMALAKLAGKAPRQVAELIVQHLPPAPFLAKVEIAGAGFINFTLALEYLKQQVESIIAEGAQLFTLTIGAGKRAQVEFVSANPTGPLHIGRSRGAILGDTMARLLEAAGYQVQREYYFNNAGVQMVNLGNSLRVRYLQALGQAIEQPAEDDTTFYQGEYLIDFARDLVQEQGEALLEADWKPFKEYAEKRMFAIIRATLERVNIRHDDFFNENSLYDSNAVWDTLEALKAGGHIYASPYRDGADDEERAKMEGKAPAQWFRSTTFGDEEDRVMVKGNGEPTYTLPDIAYHRNKLGRGFDLCVNVLGADHATQYKVVSYGLQALGLPSERIHVLLLQLVHILKDGQRAKMSTRRGDYDTLDDLIDATSADAVRFLLLARDHNSHLDFDIDLAIKQSNDNPVYYIQNAHVRCAGIFREAEARGLNDENADLSLLGDHELAFIRKALELGDVIEQAALNYEPHRIAFYAKELAATFHPVYDNVRAIGIDVDEATTKARLRFYRAAKTVFARVLALMGMSAPERM